MRAPRWVLVLAVLSLRAAADVDASEWQLGNALDDVKAQREDACLRLDQALQHWWQAPNTVEWPRVMRVPIPSSLSSWRAAADECARKGLEPGPERARPWGPAQLFVSPVLQDPKLREQVVAQLREMQSVETVADGGIDWLRRGGGSSNYESHLPDRFVDPTSSPPTVTGLLDPVLVQKVVRANRGQLRYCYERQLYDSPELKGQVTVKFTIATTGVVSRVEVTQSTLGNVPVEACVVTRVRAWLFPKPKGGGTATVLAPFRFEQVPEAR